MNEYKMTKKEKALLDRWNNARIVFVDGANALNNQITNFVMKTIVPKMGVKQVGNTAMPINIDFEKGTISMGITKMDDRIIVPGKNGKVKVS